MDRRHHMAWVTAFSFSTRALLANASEPATTGLPLVPINAIDKHLHDVARARLS